MKKKANSIKFNILINIFYELLKIITPFITAPYIARVLGAAQIGVYSYTSSLLAYFTMFAALGTGFYGQREIARNRDDKSKYSQSFWEIETISIFTTLVSLIIWIVLCTFYAEYRTYLLLLTFSLIANIFDIGWLYNGLEKYIYTVSINSLIKVLSIVLTFLFVKSPDDLYIYILIYSLTTLFGNISMWFFLNKNISSFTVRKKTLIHNFKETIVYFIPTIATTIYAVLDKTLIGLLVNGYKEVIDPNGNLVMIKNSELENGYYEQASKIINMVKVFVFMSINNVISSRASYLYGKNKDEEVRKLLLSALNLTFFLTIGCVFGIIGIADIFIPLFLGPGYDKSIFLLILMSPLLLMLCIENSLSSIYFTPVGKRKQCNYYIIAGCILNLTLNVPLIIIFQSYGAIIATLISELATTLLFIANSRSVIDFRTLFILTYKKIISGIMLLIILIIEQRFIFYDCHNLLSLLIAVGTGIIIYILFLIILKDDSISIVKQYLSKKKFKIV